MKSKVIAKKWLLMVKNLITAIQVKTVHEGTDSLELNCHY